MLCTTEKGKEIRKKMGEKLSREEIDRMIANLKKKREEYFDIDIDEDDFESDMHDEEL